MKKILTWVIIVALFIPFTYLSARGLEVVQAEQRDKEVERIVELSRESNDVYFINDHFIQVPAGEIPTEEVIVEEVPIKKPIILKLSEPDFIPLDIELDAIIQEYLHSKCEEYELDFNFALAWIYRESRFQIDVTSPTRSDGHSDGGLVQINSKYLDYFESIYGRDFDPYNAYDAIDLLLFRYADEKSYWGELNKSENTLLKCILGSYNMGRTRYGEFITYHGYDYSYTTFIFDKYNEFKEVSTHEQ